MKATLAAVMVAGALGGWISAAQADVEFDVAVGYSHLSLDGSPRFEERDGGRMEPRISFQPSGRVPQLRLGFGVGISGYTHELDDSVIITIDDGDEVRVLEADQWESVNFIVPELQLSWRQMIDSYWFIEPGIAAGPVFANYAVTNEWWFDEDDDDETSEWDTTWGVRPFLRAGWRGEHWVFAGEASYMFAGDVKLTDQVHGEVGELFIGGFVGYRW